MMTIAFRKYMLSPNYKPSNSDYKLVFTKLDDGEQYYLIYKHLDRFSECIKIKEECKI